MFVEDYNKKNVFHPGSSLLVNRKKNLHFNYKTIYNKNVVQFGSGSEDSFRVVWVLEPVNKHTPTEREIKSTTTSKGK